MVTRSTRGRCSRARSCSRCRSRSSCSWPRAALVRPRRLRVFDTLGRTVNDITGTGTTQFDLGAVISFGRVMGVALVIAAFEIILVSVIATMFAFLYNLTVGITGGLEVTLSEDSSS
jgi:hypothetical protein